MKNSQIDGENPAIKRYKLKYLESQCTLLDYKLPDACYGFAKNECIDCKVIKSSNEARISLLSLILSEHIRIKNKDEVLKTLIDNYGEEIKNELCANQPNELEQSQTF